MTKAEISQIEKLKPYFKIITKYMEENITSHKARKSSPEIYKAIKNELGDLTLAEFQTGLSASVRAGHIKGFKGVKGRYGGYAPADASDSSDSNQVTNVNGEEKPTKYGIDFGEGITLSGADHLNWTLRGLGPPKYWGSLKAALPAVAGVILDAEVKSSITNKESIESLKILINKAEKNILDKMTILASPQTDEVNND